MATILMQRDLVVTLKKETNLNVGLLSKLHPMLPELSRLIFKENALEKPTQNLFNHLSYYLVSIIDSQVHASLTWPLYDTKAERAYRIELSSFISDYSSKGLLTHVMSSYLVNPGCYKVTVLIFQLSQLAVNRLLTSKMLKDSKKALYNTMTNKYKLQEKNDFVECIDKETEVMLSKFSNYLCKRKIMEETAALFRKKITEMQSKLHAVNGQNYINNLVDNFIKQHEVDEYFKNDILKIKNINEQSPFFDKWLSDIDNKLDNIEGEWNTKVLPLLELCNNTLQNTEAIIHRHTGQVEKSSYMIEYDPKTDEIDTTDLEGQVNSQLKYILRNLEKDGVQNFPNLIRAFVISICFILKNNEIGDEIYTFNSYLEGGKRNFGEVVEALKVLIDRVLNAEAKLQPAPITYDQMASISDYPEIPPMPDLSDLKTNRDQYQVFFDKFTPLNLYKHQFNLRRRRTSGNFRKPQPKSLITPFYQVPKEDFLKSLISCHISSYDNANMTQNSHNMSVISSVKVNETIAECSSGFTKQQIIKLLSTRKSSSSKKFKYKQDRPNINIKKGGLFNESVNSNESNGLFRSYSSPNLFENREKRSINTVRGRKLSIMEEDSPSRLDVSGITCLDSDSNCNTPHGLGNAESSRQIDTSSLPTITVTKEAEDRINYVLNDMKVDLSKEMDSIVSPILEVPRKSLEQEMQSSKTETPKTNTSLIKKTSSLEKIINRFKKVRANVLPQKNEEINEIKTIIEEKENVNFDVYTANRILLPDLLSPSCSTLRSNVNINYLDQLCFDMEEEVERKKPRESLGTALGVDQTFLDQFDLID